jgi:hypothetical protein
MSQKGDATRDTKVAEYFPKSDATRDTKVAGSTLCGRRGYFPKRRRDQGHEGSWINFAWDKKKIFPKRATQPGTRRKLDQLCSRQEEISAIPRDEESIRIDARHFVCSPDIDRNPDGYRAGSTPVLIHKSYAGKPGTRCLVRTPKLSCCANIILAPL